LKALEEKGDPCAGALNILTEELISQQSFGAPSLAMLTGAIKNVAPKIKELRTNSESSKLPCLVTANKMFSAYKEKITSLVTLVGSMGILPENLVDGLKTLMQNLKKPKDEF
jgi:hypothetical protein